MRVSLTPRLDPAVVGSRALELAREAAIAEQAKLAHQDSHPAEPEPANNVSREVERENNKYVHVRCMKILQKCTMVLGLIVICFHGPKQHMCINT